MSDGTFTIETRKGKTLNKWVIELEHVSLGGWGYRAFRLDDRLLPSAFSLRGTSFSREGALKKAKKDIKEFVEPRKIERVEVDG